MEVKSVGHRGKIIITDSVCDLWNLGKDLKPVPCVSESKVIRYQNIVRVYPETVTSTVDWFKESSVVRFEHKCYGPLFC